MQPYRNSYRRVRFGKSLLFFLLLMLANGSRAGRDPSCIFISSNLHSCSDVLRLGFLIGKPSPQCCRGIRFIKEAALIFGVPKACHCVRNCANTHIFRRHNTQKLSGSLKAGAPISNKAPDFNGDIFIQLQKKCRVDLGFGLDQNIPCLIIK
ncbi:hypothetical protein RCOM_1508440 [Ricinus communis]|uniref:Bifunctional inhibitor/plant lipid transfer protein/seed storage helical domain-containing protein n=1 Tax=Ricinus communis TaxID=3988 RepID=B9RAT1_RICCO|nr:hypothetical protein RCOM_1508440 [Ricinus communis]